MLSLKEWIEKVSTTLSKSVKIVRVNCSSMTVAANSRGNQNIYEKVNAAIPSGYRFLCFAGWDLVGAGLVLQNIKYADSAYALSVRNVTANSITAEPYIYVACVPNVWGGYCVALSSLSHFIERWWEHAKRKGITTEAANHGKPQLQLAVCKYYKRKAVWQSRYGQLEQYEVRTERTGHNAIYPSYRVETSSKRHGNANQPNKDRGNESNSNASRSCSGIQLRHFHISSINKCKLRADIYNTLTSERRWAVC